MTPSIPRPKSIRLFLADGEPNGLIIATIPNWSGSIVIGRNSDLPKLLNRPEASRTGIYILFSDHSQIDDLHRIYIGKASQLRKRIQRHAQEKEWWDSAALISTTDTNFSTSHFEQLESRLIQLATEAKAANLDNSANPDKRAGQLGEADDSAVDGFLEDMELLLPVLGLDYFRRPPEPSSITPSDSQEADTQVQFLLTNKGVELARATLVNSEFVILKGSRTLKDPGHTSSRYGHLRTRLLTNNILKEAGEHYVFMDDFVTSSPSKAASIILDRSANGRIEWKIGSKTFHEWQENQITDTGESEP